MSLSLAEIKRAKVASFRDVADGLDSMAAANRDMKRGVERLPIMGDGWKGVSGDAAHHDLDSHGKYLDAHAQAQQGAAAKIRRAADEFEGVQQLLKKIESDAAQGKFTINDDTGEVTPPNGKYDKNELDYLRNTLRQIQAAGDAASTDLEAAVKAAQTLPDPSGSTEALPAVPGSAIKPNGSLGALQNLAAPNPDGDPGATKAAAAAGTDTQANYKEWYPKTTVPGSDKPIDPTKLGGLQAAPGVRDGRDQIPQRMSPTLQARDVPAFKETTRTLLQKQGVPADQIEAKVNDAVQRAQTPHFLPDAPSATPSEHVSRDFGEQFNKFTNGISDSASRTVEGQIEQGKVLTGQAGPGAPGVAEAWKDLAVDTGKNLLDQAHQLTTDPLAAPKMGIEEARDFANSPSEYIGKNIIHGTEALATGAIGGEAAAGARGLLGDLTGTEGHAITHGLDSPHPAPGGDHHAPASSDHLGGTGGDHSPASGDNHTPLSDGGGWESPSGGASLSPEHNAAANQFLEQAQQAEPHITQSLRDIVGNNPGSELTGLEYRLKAEDSFKQKLFGSIDTYPNLSTAEHLAGMKDSVRYTMQSPEGLYSANTQRAIDNLIADGYEPVKFKNTWDQPGYQGINSFWRDPATGQTFEVQFHTPSSFDAKMQTHPLYEQERLPDISPQTAADLQQQQKRIFDSVPRPSGSSAISLPTNEGHK
ncbi:ATP nucleotide 3'-pyrophosphokinase [Mycobacteroides saopaulense]|uniref:ATP nucleotide 3'-pyrophosphokinase n=1 Tax=Mycobacteroides saopaulense TaxID=1578165 RepID=UPI001F47EDA2|nr:ATP nucleotide 3'-pyrophosphokinase [Mycobacteroides saopaulense]